MPHGALQRMSARDGAGNSPRAGPPGYRQTAGMPLPSIFWLTLLTD